jgi:hypothetical protein
LGLKTQRRVIETITLKSKIAAQHNNEDYGLCDNRKSLFSGKATREPKKLDRMKSSAASRTVNARRKDESIYYVYVDTFERSKKLKSEAKNEF